MWMDMQTLIFYLGNFLAPALAVSVLVSLFKFDSSLRKPFFGVFGRILINLLVGSFVLMAGLISSGEDGKMLTYAGLITCVATSQWILIKGWSG